MAQLQNMVIFNTVNEMNKSNYYLAKLKLINGTQIG